MAHQAETGHHADQVAEHSAGPSVGHEAEHAEEHTTTGINHRKLLMWVFLSSDCLFFGSLIATYMVYRGQSLVGPYPVDIIDVPITTISTFVLLCSSFAMVQALAATNANNQKGIQLWLLATAFLGAIFIGFQVFEFYTFLQEGLHIRTNLFASTFYTLTGFHGAHVTLGIVWLLGLFIIARKGRLGPRTALDVELAGLYWHFVDIVWIVIFTLVYLIGGFDTGPAAASISIPVDPSILGFLG